jgi:hypothetical protein
LEEPTEAPLFTVFVWVAGLPPSASKVTVYMSKFHQAYTVISPVTVVVSVNSVPPPLIAVYQPVKVYPLLVGVDGILEEPAEAPLFTVFVWVVGLPPAASKVTVNVSIPHRA